MGLLRPLRVDFLGCFWAVLGGVKIGNAFLKKTRVGFGSAEVSLRGTGTTVRALSSGHGPRDLGFQGVFSR